MKQTSYYNCKGVAELKSPKCFFQMNACRYKHTMEHLCHKVIRLSLIGL